MDYFCTVENARLKNRYRAGLLIAYRLDVLDADTLRTIPSSTLCDWRRRDITGIVGFDPEAPWLRELNFNGKSHRRRFLKRTVIALVRVSFFQNHKRPRSASRGKLKLRGK